MTYIYILYVYYILYIYMYLCHLSVHACPDRPWGPPNLLYNGHPVFPGSKVRPGRAADHSPLLVRRAWKNRAIPLPILWATPGLYRGYFTFTFINSI
jgi:hypothetical protein